MEKERVTFLIIFWDPRFKAMFFPNNGLLNNVLILFFAPLIVLFQLFYFRFYSSLPPPLWQKKAIQSLNAHHSLSSLLLISFNSLWPYGLCTLSILFSFSMFLKKELSFCVLSLFIKIDWHKNELKWFRIMSVLSWKGHSGQRFNPHFLFTTLLFK